MISNMLLRNDGRYWPCVFGGWYETDEIAGRDLAPARRFNVLPMVADSIGLSRDPHIEPLWQDLALAELHRAVVDSFRKAGVMFSTPQQEADRFRRHVEREQCRGRATPTDRTWIMPATNPILCSTDEIADYDPPMPDADPQYVHVPRFHRMGRHGWEREEDRRPEVTAWRCPTPATTVRSSRPADLGRRSPVRPSRSLPQRARVQLRSARVGRGWPILTVGQLGSLGGLGELTKPVDLLVEGIENGPELHLRHLGEHPDVLDV